MRLITIVLCLFAISCGKSNADKKVKILEEQKAALLKLDKSCVDFFFNQGRQDSMIRENTFFTEAGRPVIKERDSIAANRFAAQNTYDSLEKELKKL
jgi:hypothetical protein